MRFDRWFELSICVLELFFINLQQPQATQSGLELTNHAALYAQIIALGVTTWGDSTSRGDSNLNMCSGTSICVVEPQQVIGTTPRRLLLSWNQTLSRSVTLTLHSRVTYVPTKVNFSRLRVITIFDFNFRCEILKKGRFSKFDLKFDFGIESRGIFNFWFFSFDFKAWSVEWYNDGWRTMQ